MNSRPELPPTAELLLDVRTPAELAFSPEAPGSRSAARHGRRRRFVRAERSTCSTESRRRPCSSPAAPGRPRPRGRPTARVWRSCRTGSRRGTSSRIRCPPGDGEPRSLRASTGSAESVAWSRDGSRLLVLAADPGSYGLDWGARAVKGAEPDARPGVRRPGDARRRLFLIDLASGESRGRAARPQRVGGGLGRRRHRRRRS